jgi:hypothetical protein
MRGCMLAAAFALTVTGAHATEWLNQGSEQAFTESMAARLRTLVPTLKVAVDSPLNLKVTLSEGEAVLNLARVWTFCNQNPAPCVGEAEGHLDSTAAQLRTFDGKGLKPTADQLRVAMRPKAYTDRIRGFDPTLLVRPLAGDLEQVMMLDTPKNASPVSAAGLKELGLTAEQAWARAAKNTLAELTPAPKPPAPGQVAHFGGGRFYESSRLLDHAGWGRVAKATRGGLFVVVPSRDMIIWGDAAEPGIGKGMVDIARESMGQSPIPLTDTLFRWTPKGWAVQIPK